MEVRGVISFNLHMGQLQRKIRFLVVLGLNTNIVLETAFIRNKVKKISSKSMLTTPVKPDLVAILNVLQKSPFGTFDNVGQRLPHSEENAEESYTVAPARTLVPRARN